MMKLLIIIAGGGFLFESEKLLSILGDKSEKILVTSCQEKFFCQRFPDENNIYYIPEMYSRKIKNKFIIKGYRFIKTLFYFYKILNKEKPEAVIWVGDALGLPAGVCAKLMGIKVIFIESITRVDNPSLTGKIVDKLFIANRIYVQWPELLHLYKRAIYKGNLL